MSGFRSVEVPADADGAAHSEDHELIQTARTAARHPIYASMLGMLLATAAAWSWWPM